MKVLVYTRAADSSGDLSIVYPSESIIAQYGPTGAVDHLEAKLSLTATMNPAGIESDDLPYKGRLRNAWRRQGPNAVVVDMPEARALKTDLVRKDRDHRLNESDKEMQRAQDKNNPAEIARLKSKREALRDLPANIQADLAQIQTASELDAWEPTWPT